MVQRIFERYVRKGHRQNDQCDGLVQQGLKTNSEPVDRGKMASNDSKYGNAAALIRPSGVGSSGSRLWERNKTCLRTENKLWSYPISS